MSSADWPDVQRIYALGIATGDATFADATPDWSEFDRTKLPSPRLVAVDEGSVVGWVAVSATSARAVYRGVVEHSVYVDPHASGRGIGRTLIEAMIRDAPAAGIWTIQSSIFPENAASLRLHESAGFRVVGRRERIGLMSFGPRAGEWRDTILIEWRAPAPAERAG